MPFKRLLFIAAAEATVSVILLALSFTAWAAPISGFLKALAESVFVAAVLTGTFELVSRQISSQEFRRARTLLTEQIIRVLSNTRQPDRVLRAVEEQVISQETVRYDYEYTVELEPLAGEPGYVNLTLITMYRVKNLTTQTVEYWVPHSLTIENEDRFPGVTRIEYVQAKLDGETNYVLNYGGPGTREAGSVLINTIVPIPRDRELHVEARVSGVRLVNDKEMFIVTTPSLDAQISIHALTEFDVRIETIHPTAVAEPVRSVTTERRWKIASVLLPGQGVEIMWKRRG